MSLKTDKLVNTVFREDGSVVSQCPACAEEGHDLNRRDHLIIFPDGRFGCASNVGDHNHRQRIFELVGENGPRSFSVRPTKADVSRFESFSILGKLETLFGTLGTGNFKPHGHCKINKNKKGDCYIGALLET